MKSPIFIRGNSLEELKKIPDNSINLIFADPPYWMRVEGKLKRVEGTDFDGCDDEWDNQFEDQSDYKTFTTIWLSECKRILAKDGAIWVIGGMQCIYTIGGIMQDLGFWILNDVIWHKTNPTPNFKGTRLTNSHETLIWATKSEKAKFTFNYKTAKELNKGSLSEGDWAKGLRKQMGSVWRFGVCQGKERLQNEEGEKLHTTQKPEKLLHRIITISSKVGDTILDPFGGTMTTGAVATKLGRSVIMLEQEEEYFMAGKKRISQMLPFLDDIAMASFDVKPPKAKTVDMIADKYFEVEETWYFKPNTNGDYKGFVTLLADGKVIYGDKTIDMHTAAGLVKNGGARQNGWSYWYVKRGEKFLSVDDIRHQYRQEQLDYVDQAGRASIAGDNSLGFPEFQQLMQQTDQGTETPFSVHCQLLYRLVEHAGLALIEKRTTPDTEHFLFQQPNGLFIHICHCLIPTLDITSSSVYLKSYQEQHQHWVAKTQNLHSILYFFNSQDRATECRIQLQALELDESSLFQGQELFTYLGREIIWNIYQDWIENWDDVPSKEEEIIQLQLQLEDKGVNNVDDDPPVEQAEKNGSKTDIDDKNKEQ